MTNTNSTFDNFTLTDLGFSPYFRSQLSLEELEQLQPMRIIDVQRDRISALGEHGTVALSPGTSLPTAEFAVGDWVLVDADHCIVRVLTPKSSLHRRAAGTNVAVQSIANNVDTLFIVSSCNADFNEARLERYLALSREANVTAVVLLTKADLIDQASQFKSRAEALMSNLVVLPVNATSENVKHELEPWCGPGQTVALVGSSGVGKTTLMNALTGGTATTQSIREADSKGKHTTTARSMLPIINGGWVIDTPGMRALRLHDSAEGITAVFEEFIETASYCKFKNSGQ